MTHFIRKQIIDIAIQNGLDALAIQDRINDRFWIDLLPVIEAEFDKVAKEGVDYKIEQIQIDLGNISEEMIESGEWASLLRQQLSEKLREILEGSASETSWKMQRAYANIFDQWCYFLDHGYLPWNTFRPTEQWYERVLEALGKEYKSADRIRGLINERKEIAERIVRNHDHKFLTHLVELLTAERQSTLPDLIQELSAWLKELLIHEPSMIRIQHSELANELWASIVRNAADGKSGRSTKELVKVLMGKLLSVSEEDIEWMLKLRVVRFSHPILKSALQELISGGLPGKKIPEEKDDQSDEQDAAQTLKPDQHVRDITDEKAIETGTEKVDSINTEIRKRVASHFSKTKEEIEHRWQPDHDSIDEDGIYINHAGIVLLHPFLHAFFRKIELVKEGAFVDEVKQQRAICLLHEFAGTGEAIREYDLVLPKLLCSWPLQRPVITSTEFTPEEKNEILNLLQAVIEQWEILKNSSPSALQETFLQRGGKLLQRNSQWWLQVEPNSMDVLLDRLPWTISMIKLPWMKELLRVEWR